MNSLRDKNQAALLKERVVETRWETWSSLNANFVEGTILCVE